jgi:hypothetical protein
VALSDDFIQRSGTHPGSERRICKLSCRNRCSYLIWIGIIK